MMKNWAVVGLGNPGSQYCLNRHNIGFMVLDVLADILKAPSYKIKQNMLFSECTCNSAVNGEKNRLFLIKPQTFMNLSGRALSPLLAFYKIPLENVIVFHDELDLEPGRVKVKKGGSSGGHNGLKSLDSSVGTDYWRVRIGIGHPGHKDAVTGYVLSNFSKTELDGWVPRTLEATTRHLEAFLATLDANTYAKSVQQSSID